MINQPRSPISALAEKCAQEIHHFFDSDDGDEGKDCLRLFRIAIIHRNEEAWEAIYQQFEPLVKGWILRHPAFSQTGEEADHFVNMAFMRFWGALAPERCNDFDDIRSVLRYLQTCTHSAIVDYLRSRRREVLDIESTDVQYQIEKKGEIISQQIHHAIYCQQVLEAAAQRMKTPQERLIFYEAYVLGMKPNAIYQQHPQEFQSVKEIYRIKENILARLRRDKELQQMLV